MNYKSVISFLAFTFFLSASYAHISNIVNLQEDTISDSPVIADSAKLNLVSDQFSFTEGPAADRDGNVYFTDQPNNRIWKYDADGRLSIFMENAGRSNGLYFDKKGNLIACADEKDELWKISKKGKVKVLVTDFKGKRLNGPNDLWVAPNQSVYFTDPYYQRSYWKRTHPDLDGQYVYYLPKGERNPVLMISDLKKPNGVVGTPDGKYLYIADIGDSLIYRYEIDKDGSLVNRKLFANRGSDGMTIDNLGNIYLVGNGVTVYNPEGKIIEHINVPEKWTSNVCFGGKERNMLFITASKSVYTLKMKVRGVSW